MKKIISTALIANSKGDAEQFGNNVNEAINKMQKEELEVEVQYQEVPGGFSAFIIGRKKCLEISQD